MLWTLGNTSIWSQTGYGWFYIWVIGVCCILFRNQVTVNPAEDIKIIMPKNLEAKHNVHFYPVFNILLWLCAKYILQGKN